VTHDVQISGDYLSSASSLSSFTNLEADRRQHHHRHLHYLERQKSAT